MENNEDLMSKMMEFGVGLAVAQQMVGTMNSVMSGMAVPKEPLQPPAMSKVEVKYYVLAGENVAGPFSETELVPLIQNGTLTAKSLVWKNGLTSWVTADSIPEVNKCLLLNG